MMAIVPPMLIIQFGRWTAKIISPSHLTVEVWAFLGDDHTDTKFQWDPGSHSFGHFIYTTPTLKLKNTLIPELSERLVLIFEGKKEVQLTSISITRIGSRVQRQLFSVKQLKLWWRPAFPWWKSWQLSFKIFFKEQQVLCGFVLESVNADPGTGPLHKCLHISSDAASLYPSDLGVIKFSGNHGNRIDYELKGQQFGIRCW